MKNKIIGFLLVVIFASLAFAAIPRNTGTLQKDADSVGIQSPPTFSLIDGSASIKTITNAALTSNVVTLTSVAHGLIVGQQVTVVLLTGPTLFADMNGTYIITSVATDTFTYALTHANISTGAATGTATAYFASPMPAATGQIALVFPRGAVHLVVMPGTVDATLRKISGGATAGTFTLKTGVANGVNGVEGDTVYVQRTSSTTLDFAFDIMGIDR